jgi:TonB family protein
MLFDSAVAATVVLAAAWAMTLALSRASADLRRAVWRAAVAAVAGLPWLVLVPVAGSVGPAVGAVALPSAAAFGAVPAPVWSWVLAVWAVGWLAVAGRLAVGLWRIAAWSRAALDGDGVRWSSEVAVPLTWGALRPEILLPAAARDWPANERDLVMRHESAHVASHDWVWQILTRLVVSVLWFHPLAWLADREIRREAERAADDAVLATGVGAAEYAAQLVKVARAAVPHAIGGVAMATASSLEARVDRVLEGGERRGPASRRAIVAVASAMAFLAVTAAAMQSGPVYQVDDPGVTAPEVIRSVQPRYPPEAKADGVEGTVIVGAIVTEEGLPDDVKILQPAEPSLDRAAQRAALEWRFVPGQRAGKAVRVAVQLEFRFSLK